jgi:hypothetical protein
MKTSAVCPACGARLGFWAVIRAPTPFRLACPSCKAMLRVVLRGMGLITLAIFLLLLSVALLTYFAWKNGGWGYFYGGMVALLVLWMLIEVQVGLLIFNRARLEVRAPGGK